VQLQVHSKEEERGVMDAGNQATYLVTARKEQLLQVPRHVTTAVTRRISVENALKEEEEEVQEEVNSLQQKHAILVEMRPI